MVLIIKFITREQRKISGKISYWLSKIITEEREDSKLQEIKINLKRKRVTELRLLNKRFGQ